MGQREQLNLRLPPEWFVTLAAAAFLEDATVAEYVKEVVGQRVASLHSDPAIAEMLRVKAERSAAKDGDVPRLDDRRRDKEA